MEEAEGGAAEVGAQAGDSGRTHVGGCAGHTDTPLSMHEPAWGLAAPGMPKLRFLPSQ